ncbi:unnamed protein product [Phytomonas sp. Hart1]|nr:unnamed protein product [Phytomonas sp. Hart1]|eukprot:CCW69910.1 unnamed protein product [Phytomonas sp. isolate Hart1]
MLTGFKTGSEEPSQITIFTIFATLGSRIQCIIPGNASISDSNSPGERNLVLPDPQQCPSVVGGGGSISRSSSAVTSTMGEVQLSKPIPLPPPVIKLKNLVSFFEGIMHPELTKARPNSREMSLMWGKNPKVSVKSRDDSRQSGDTNSDEKYFSQRMDFFCYETGTPLVPDALISHGDVVLVFCDRGYAQRMMAQLLTQSGDARCSEVPQCPPGQIAHLRRAIALLKEVPHLHYDQLLTEERELTELSQHVWDALESSQILSPSSPAASDESEVVDVQPVRFFGQVLYTPAALLHLLTAAKKKCDGCVKDYVQTMEMFKTAKEQMGTIGVATQEPPCIPGDSVEGEVDECMIPFLQNQSEEQLLLVRICLSHIDKTRRLLMKVRQVANRLSSVVKTAERIRTLQASLTNAEALLIRRAALQLATVRRWEPLRSFHQALETDIAGFLHAEEGGVLPEKVATLLRASLPEVPPMPDAATQTALQLLAEDVQARPRVTALVDRLLEEVAQGEGAQGEGAPAGDERAPTWACHGEEEGAAPRGTGLPDDDDSRRPPPVARESDPRVGGNV